MKPRSSTIIAVCAAGLVGLGAAWFALQQPESKPKSEERQNVSAVPTPLVVEHAAPVEAPKPLISATSAAPVASAAGGPLDEASLMKNLREMRADNEILALLLAREGNERFPDSPDAAERSWVIVKSLSRMGRHAEALEEARVMVQKHKGTRFADDVYRHLLVNPGTHPFEGGHGK